MKALGYILQFFEFAYNLFHKDSDDHLEEAYDKVQDQDETISELEEENNYKDFESAVKEVQQQTDDPDFKNKAKEFYKNRGKKE